ncbi:MAG: hypothetical protein RMM58_07305 [Chloroflexota bacterium]|nr:hypothetical protein [Dehalococcoidia bacterium]MDW8253666.1 hypothetical protein [Chloroflexota bacterium]
MPVVEAKPTVDAASPIVRLTADLRRSTIAACEDERGRPYVLVTAEPLRFDREHLLAEADSNFGFCLVIRLTGHAPAIGILRQTERGFREYWRTLAPSARALLRRLQTAVEEAETVPVFWRTADDTVVEFHLGGYNRQHRVWYSRLDAVDPEAPLFLLCPPTPDEPERRPLRYGSPAPRR